MFGQGRPQRGIACVQQRAFQAVDVEFGLPVKNQFKRSIIHSFNTAVFRDGFFCFAHSYADADFYVAHRRFLLVLRQ